MSTNLLNFTPELHSYLLSVSLRENPLLVELREETKKLTESNMQISPEQGQFMSFLVELIQAKKVLEIVMMIDNVLWSGKVIDQDYQDMDTLSIRNLNQSLYSDHRISISILPISDGLTLIRKR